MSLNEKFPDLIANLCLKHFQSIAKTGKPKENEWTVLSCIVKQQNSDFEVVALGTGSKCIGQDKMSPNGDILNDSHAEIMCRRAFMRYIYENLLDISTKNRLFQYNCASKIFTINLDVKFHFFTTFVPCGDAAIFQKQNTDDIGEIIENNENNKRKSMGHTPSDIQNKKFKPDIYRTGAKCLPENTSQDLRLDGHGYHTVGVVRTKPGRGVSTLSVSCSDKLAKWCHLGIQGALLSMLLQNPIYLSSFTIVGNTQFNKQALYRALFDRVKNVELTLPFKKINDMKIAQSNLEFLYQKTDEKTPSPSSIAWLKSNDKKALEVAVEGKRQGITKKQMNAASSRLKITKLELFKMFCKIVKKYEINFKCGGVENLSYIEAKMLSKQYQEAWSVLKKEFKYWTNKPKNLLNFTFE